MTPAGAARESPPLGLILPFFLTAPLGLVAAGIMLVLAHADATTAVNTPELLAATHAAVLGWLSLSIMGALFQLGPVLFSGRLLPAFAIRAQLVLHVAGVSLMVGAFGWWRTGALAAGGTLTASSFVLFVLNAAFAVRWFARGSLVRNYVSIGLVFLSATAALGLSYAFALYQGWFPLTSGRVAAHAHLGLAGFLGIVIMGVSYQLVPMFQLSPHAEPRFARVVLPWMAVSVVMFAAIMWTDPPPAVRALAAGLIASGAAMWMYDVSWLVRRRAKRSFDIQGRSTLISLAFLTAAIVVGVLAASGQPAALAVERQRLQLSYGFLLVGGWAGATLLGNSFKIVPFLVWNGRFRERAGREPVPTLAQLLHGRLAHVTLYCLAAAVLVGACSASIGWLPGLRLAGAMLSTAGTLQFLSLLLVAMRHPAANVVAGAPAKGIPT